ncbi:MAG: aquaporin, partial [Acidimicrobiales bacterium]
MSTEHQRRLLVMCASEMIGTALLVGIGLSIVIFDFGRGSPVSAVLPSAAARRALTGGLFGATGMTIALSPVGRISGAHINPVVSIAFWAERTLPTRALLAFMASQLLGATLGATPLLLWGEMGRSIAYGA